MKILLTIGSYNPTHGGPYFSVSNLAKGLHLNNNEVRIITASYPNLPVQVPPEGVSINSFNAIFLPLIRQSYIFKCKKQLNSWVKEFKPDIIHDNGLWLTLNNASSKVAIENKIPYIISPRGCLELWAMQYKNWKKEIALNLYQLKILENAKCFHAASENEADSIRRLNLKQPIALIPNGIEIKNNKDTIISTDNTNYALFLGRLHPVKNLTSLIKAWAKIKPRNWILRIVGADEVGYKKTLQGLALELGIFNLVEFLGEKYNEEKEDILSNSKLLFLVSHSENFGVVVAEALSAGVPVIASKTTPWRCLETERIGWWVDNSIDGIANAITEYLEMDDISRNNMSKRAFKYAKIHFSIYSTSKRFNEVYSWMKNDTAIPNWMICN